jgi:hypothetical protein
MVEAHDREDDVESLSMLAALESWAAGHGAQPEADALAELTDGALVALDPRVPGVVSDRSHTRRTALGRAVRGRRDHGAASVSVRQIGSIRALPCVPGDRSATQQAPRGIITNGFWLAVVGGRLPLDGRPLIARDSRRIRRYTRPNHSIR